MKEFKIGGTVTLSEDEKYIIVDIINLVEDKEIIKKISNKIIKG